VTFPLSLPLVHIRDTSNTWRPLFATDRSDQVDSSMCLGAPRSDINGEVPERRSQSVGVSGVLRFTRIRIARSTRRLRRTGLGLDPGRLTRLWAFTAWYEDSFTLLLEVAKEMMFPGLHLKQYCIHWPAVEYNGYSSGSRVL
jgi:hypothetical protein